jgi:phenylalanyl-tRNA synthetase beta chain
MQIPESWLRRYANPSLSTDELAHLLTMSGLEVESVRPVAPAFEGVVVGEVLKVDRHPNADKLAVCSVGVGSGEPLQIVCGAPNVRAGMKAPLAKIGARLPLVEGKPFEIKPAKLRGVESSGMLCSARELGLSDEHGGLVELAADAMPGEDVRRALQLDDSIFTLKLTSNRADCLSVVGVAREVAALAGVELKLPKIEPVAPRSDAKLPVRVLAPDLCGRFSGRVIRNVNAKAATPDWIKQRLERCGQRSISALVDISNYVMLELGRPSHIFDLDKVEGGALEVRWGRAGEKAELLNGQTVEVAPNVGVIADAARVEALAGIMGGAPTAVSDATRNIYVEAAFWWPAAIAGRARGDNNSTHAGHRFERGVDFATTAEHIEYITRLVLGICGGEPGPVDDTVLRLPERKPVRMRVARAQKLIGVAIAPDEMAAIFERLGLAFERGADAFTVTPPSYRFDLEIEEDLVEEVARVYGFERIPALPPRATAAALPVPEALRPLHVLRERLAAADYDEVINYSFVEPAWEADLAGNADPIRLLNPIASQLSVMRSSLLGSLLANLRYNVARKMERVRVFEIGRVFVRDAHAADGALTLAGLHQPVRVGAAAYGSVVEAQWGLPARAVDFFDVKADLESLAAPLALRFEAAAHPALHPGRSARVTLGDRPVGWLGELHPRWQRKYELPHPAVLLEIEAQALCSIPVAAPRVPSRSPPVVRDIALVFDAGVPVQTILDTVRPALPPLVQEFRVFDLYQGSKLPEGKKSVAFRVVMQDTARTLTDAETDAARDAIVGLMARHFGAELRS